MHARPSLLSQVAAIFRSLPVQSSSIIHFRGDEKKVFLAFQEESQADGGINMHIVQKEKKKIPYSGEK